MNYTNSKINDIRVLYVLIVMLQSQLYNCSYKTYNNTKQTNKERDQFINEDKTFNSSIEQFPGSK